MKPGNVYQMKHGGIYVVVADYGRLRPLVIGDTTPDMMYQMNATVGGMSCSFEEGRIMGKSGFYHDDKLVAEDLEGFMLRERPMKDGQLLSPLADSHFASDFSLVGRRRD